jgi:hypothetical protein
MWADVRADVEFVSCTIQSDATVELPVVHATPWATAARLLSLLSSRVLVGRCDAVLEGVPSLLRALHGECSRVASPGQLVLPPAPAAAAALLTPSSTGLGALSLRSLLPCRPTVVAGATAAALVSALTPEAVYQALESPLRHVRHRAYSLLGCLGKVGPLCPAPPTVLHQLTSGRACVSRCLRALGRQAPPPPSDPAGVLAYRVEADACAGAVMQLLALEGHDRSPTPPLQDVDRDVVAALVRLIVMHAADGGGPTPAPPTAGAVAAAATGGMAGGRGGAGVGGGAAGGAGAGAAGAAAWDARVLVGAPRVPSGVAMFAISALRGLCDGPSGAVQRLLFSVGAISQLANVLDAGDAVTEDVQSATASVLLLCFSVEGVVGSLVRAQRVCV